MGLGEDELIGEDDSAAGEDNRGGLAKGLSLRGSVSLALLEKSCLAEGLSFRGGISLALVEKSCLAEGLSDLAVSVYDDGTSSDSLRIGTGNTLWPTLRGVVSLAGCVKCLALLSRSDRLGVADLTGAPSSDILNSLALRAKS